MLTILFLAGLFENLPEATLAAIVIHAVSGMIDVSKLARLWHTHRDEFVLAAGALLGVILIGILAGVVIGVALSFALLIHRLDHPHTALLGLNRSGTTFVEIDGHEGTSAVPGVLIHRFEAPLVFANAEVFTDDVLAQVDCRRSLVDDGSPRLRSSPGGRLDGRRSALRPAEDTGSSWRAATPRPSDRLGPGRHARRRRRPGTRPGLRLRNSPRRRGSSAAERFVNERP